MELTVDNFRKIFSIIFQNKLKKEELAQGSIVYSQEGEDLLLERLMNKRDKGYFVDIGAHHPIFLSNTYYFYKKGWRGVNIDPIPGFKINFDSIRPEDVNIEAGISDIETELNYYVFNWPELNTFSLIQAEKFLEWEGVKIIEQIPMKTLRLDNLLRSLKVQGEIDFFNIDVEGYEDQILKSNNWELYSPRFIMIEQLNTDLEKLDKTFVFNYLDSYGYRFIAKTLNTYFYCKKEIIFNH